MFHLLLDVGTLEVAGVLTVAALFFLAGLAGAWLAFRMLRRTVRAGVRMAIVAAILLFTLAGGVSIYFLGSGKSSPRPKPPANRTR